MVTAQSAQPCRPEHNLHELRAAYLTPDRPLQAFCLIQFLGQQGKCRAAVLPRTNRKSGAQRGGLRTRGSVAQRLERLPEATESIAHNLRSSACVSFENARLRKGKEKS